MRRTRRSSSLALLALALTGCVSQPDTYAPPIQRKPLNIEEPTSLRSFVNMSDADARLHILRDVSETLEAGSWRWARKKPVLVFVVPNTQGWKFAADIVIAESTFQETGPVTLTVSVNNHELTKVQCDKPGPLRIERPVPPEFLRPRAENQVSIEADKVYVAKADQAVLGFVLIRAGFIH